MATLLSHDKLTSPQSADRRGPSHPRAQAVGHVSVTPDLYRLRLTAEARTDTELDTLKTWAHQYNTALASQRARDFMPGNELSSWVSSLGFMMPLYEARVVLADESSRANGSKLRLLLRLDLRDPEVVGATRLYFTVSPETSNTDMAMMDPSKIGPDDVDPTFVAIEGVNKGGHIETTAAHLYDIHPQAAAAA